jgi:hypothetical protein
MDEGEDRRQRPGVGERISAWSHQGRLRESAVVMLDALDIVDTDQELLELQGRIDDTKRSLRNSCLRMVAAVYPWLLMAPFGALIAVRFKGAIGRTIRESASSKVQPASAAVNRRRQHR